METADLPWLRRHAPLPSKVPVRVTTRLEAIAALEPVAPNGNERALNGKSRAQEDDKVCRKSDTCRARH